MSRQIEVGNFVYVHDVIYKLFICQIEIEIELTIYICDILHFANIYG